MIVTIPFIAGRHNHEALIQKLRDAGPCQSHVLYVIAQKHESEQAQDFADNLSSLFTKTQVAYLNEYVRNDIRLVNDLFNKAAEVAFGHKPDNENESQQLCYFYYDPNLLPTTNGWADAAQIEWIKNGKNVLGNAEKAPDTVVETNGKELRVEGGMIFRGHIVLPKNFYVESAIINSLSQSIHWRVAMRWELATSYAESTTLRTGKNGYFRKPKAPVIPTPPSTEPK